MKYQSPKGTRDFTPEEMILREFVMSRIKKVFESYGFDSIETSVFEDLEVLNAKSGEEVSKQIFKIETEKDRKLGLRFDLTVPMARFLANNPQLPKPFKRYAIAPVWRYEEPQAGRMRQFYQADIDICGSSSMEADVECIACALDCLKILGFKNLRVKLNDRKVLEGFIEFIKKKIPAEVKIEFSDLPIFRAIDKLGKIGIDGVRKELEKIGLRPRQIEELLKIIKVKGTFPEGLERLKKLLQGISVGMDGLKELEQIFELSKFYGISSLLVPDFSMARGLDYYTGPIFEIEVESEKKIGSIAGGGRYDNLIELLGGRFTPATGISLGIERVIEIMKEEKMVDLAKTRVKVFVANVNEKVKPDAVKIAQDLRKVGINCQVDLMGRNLSKQLQFVDEMKIPFALILGEREIKSKKFKLRDMENKKELELSLEEIIKKLKESH